MLCHAGSGLGKPMRTMSSRYENTVLLTVLSSRSTSTTVLDTTVKKVWVGKIFLMIFKKGLLCSPSLLDHLFDKKI